MHDYVSKVNLLTNNSFRFLGCHSDVVPVEIEMVALCELDGKVKSNVDKLHTHTWESWGVVGWNFELGEFTLVEGQLLDGPGFKLHPFSDLNQLISCCELERHHDEQ